MPIMYPTVGTVTKNGDVYVDPRTLPGNPLCSFYCLKFPNHFRNEFHRQLRRFVIGKLEDAPGYWVLNNKIRGVQLDNTRRTFACSSFNNHIEAGPVTSWPVAPEVPLAMTRAARPRCVHSKTGVWKTHRKYYRPPAASRKTCSYDLSRRRSFWAAFNVLHVG